LGQNLNTNNFLSLEKIREQRAMLGRINPNGKRKWTEQELINEEKKTRNMIQSLQNSLAMHNNHEVIKKDLEEQIEYLTTEFKNNANQGQIEIPETIIRNYFRHVPTKGNTKGRKIYKNLPKGVVSSSGSNGLMWECIEGACKLMSAFGG
jgi:hypothetical protein